jgi:hypothetical protein
MIVFMSAPPPAPDALDPAIAPTAARTEHCLAMLERLAEKGMAVVEPVPEDGSAQSAETFAKLSRAVRLTITLIMKIQDGPRGAKAKGEGPADAAAPDPYAPFKTGKKAKVRGLLRDVIDRETPDPEESDTLGDALDERLLCDEAYDDIEDLPLRDIVERLCADLQLKPDWSRWTGDGWKPNPPFYRPLCSEFKNPSRSPVLNDLDDIPDPYPLE